MVKRHYPEPHRFVCVTDDTKGLSDVETIPLWSDFARIPSPHGGNRPSCYRRLKLFDPEIEGLLGQRFVALDLDLVITGDLRPVLNRQEDFVMYGDTDPRSFYNGSMLLMTAGARPQVWTTFDPQRSPQESMAAGRFGSDQGWISHCLGPGEARWGTADGVYSYRRHIAQKHKPVTPQEQRAYGRLPQGARVVVFHGRYDPWAAHAQRWDWVRSHYR